MNAGDIFNDSAALLNDVAKDVFDNNVQMPYLNIALAELQEMCELNNIPITNETSASIKVLAGTATKISGASLPSGLVEVQELHERTWGSSESYVPMTRCNDYLPKLTTLSQFLTYWAWMEQEIRFIGSTSDREVLIDYIQSIFTTVTTANTTIAMINSRTFLGYRTAGLCARFKFENATRADQLDAMALAAIDRSLGISVKGKQSIVARRRPFMFGVKTRGML